jgi:hypothetical protein
MSNITAQLITSFGAVSFHSSHLDKRLMWWVLQWLSKFPLENQTDQLVSQIDLGSAYNALLSSDEVLTSLLPHCSPETKNSISMYEQNWTAKTKKCWATTQLNINIVTESYHLLLVFNHSLQLTVNMTQEWISYTQFPEGQNGPCSNCVWRTSCKHNLQTPIMLGNS